jgi:hypothetical protein
MNTECAAKAIKPEMESVVSDLPNGAARLATGGENFGEVEDRRTIKGVWTESLWKNSKKTFRKIL